MTKLIPGISFVFKKKRDFGRDFKNTVICLISPVFFKWRCVCLRPITWLFTRPCVRGMSVCGCLCGWWRVRARGTMNKLTIPSVGPWVIFVILVIFKQRELIRGNWTAKINQQKALFRNSKNIEWKLPYTQSFPSSCCNCLVTVTLLLLGLETYTTFLSFCLSKSRNITKISFGRLILHNFLQFLILGKLTVFGLFIAFQLSRFLFPACISLLITPPPAGWR